MESKSLRIYAKLKIENYNLRIQILQIQAQELLIEKMKVIEAECKWFKCEPDQWQLDERNGVLIKKPEKPKEEKK